MHPLRFIVPISVLILATITASVLAQLPIAPSTTQPVMVPVPDVETIVILRHAEKPQNGLGQLTPQGLNRALALSKVLPDKFGKPDYLFAPDPGQKVIDYGVPYNYVRPLATIEPLAIRLGMPVQTPFGLYDIDRLNNELTKPLYSNATIFVTWEHGYAALAAANLFKMFGGNPEEIPKWPGPDYDSLYVIKIIRTIGHPTTVSFTHDYEYLDGQSKKMPIPAPK